MAIAVILPLLLFGLPMFCVYPMASQFCEYFLRRKKQSPYWIVFLSACISPFFVFLVIALFIAEMSVSFEPLTPHYWQSLASHGMTIGVWLKIWISSSVMSILPALLAVVIYRRLEQER